MKTRRIIAAALTAALALTSAPCYAMTNAVDTQLTNAIDETNEFPYRGRMYKFIIEEDDTTFIVCDGMTFEFSFETGEAELISGDDAEGEVIIPDSVVLPSYLVNCSPEETKWGALEAPVTMISTDAFYGNMKITSVTIPDSVKEIGCCAFEACMNLEEIIAPDKYIKLWQDALGNVDDALTVPWLQKKYDAGEEVVFCGNLLSVPDVKEYTVPDGVKAIDCAGRWLSNLETLVIPEGVESISNSFNCCEKLKDVTLPVSVSVVHNSFTSCDQLDRIIVDGSISDWLNTDHRISVDPDIYDKKGFLIHTGLRNQPVTEILEPYSKILDMENIKTSLEVGESVEFEVMGRWFYPIVTKIINGVSVEDTSTIKIEKIGSRPTDEIKNGEIVTYRATAIGPGNTTFYLGMNDFTMFSDRLEFKVTGEALDIPATVPDATAYKVEYKKMTSEAGDANCDDKVNISDVVAVIQFIANAEKYPLSDKGKANADIDGVEGISGDDAIMIMKLDAGTVVKVSE